MKASINTSCLAIIAWGLVVTFHELVHGLLALGFGARLNFLCLWSTGMRIPETWSDSSWKLGVIQGAAAIANIAIGVIAAHVFSRPNLSCRGRVFLFFIVAFSWAIGFGYLAADSITANPDSHGDWGKVIMLLGGSWAIRAPIFLVGSLGLIWTVLWLRRGVGMIGFETELPEKIGSRIMILLVIPYFAVNTAYTLLSFNHPTPELRGVIAAIVCWGTNFILIYAAISCCFKRKSMAGKTVTNASMTVSLPIIVGTIIFYAIFAAVSIPWKLGWQL